VAAEHAAAPAPRSFSYGTILTSLDNVHFARDGGFDLMSAYVAWSTVEPERGKFLFEQHDKSEDYVYHAVAHGR
jgi:hypothetical protein